MFRRESVSPQDRPLREEPNAVDTPVNTPCGAHVVIAAIDAILALTGNAGDAIRIGAHIDVLLDLRLVASEIATLDTLDTEWATQRTRRSRNSDRVAQRV
jgi:hypothetical protein